MAIFIGGLFMLIIVSARLIVGPTMLSVGVGNILSLTTSVINGVIVMILWLARLPTLL